MKQRAQPNLLRSPRDLDANLARDVEDDAVWRWIMFPYRDQLVKQAQYDDMRREADKRRLLRLASEQEPTPTGSEAGGPIRGLSFRNAKLITTAVALGLLIAGFIQFGF